MQVEVEDSRPEVKRMLVAEAIHSAKRGVTAQTTAARLVTCLAHTTNRVAGPNETSARALDQAAKAGSVWGILVALASRTCARGACLALARQQTSALVDDQVSAGNSKLEGGGMGVDEAQARRGDVLRKDCKGVCARG